jgi:hypothetical protein
VEVTGKDWCKANAAWVTVDKVTDESISQDARRVVTFPFVRGTQIKLTWQKKFPLPSLLDSWVVVKPR